MKALCLLYPPECQTERLAEVIFYQDGISGAIQAMEEAKKWLSMTGEYRQVDNSIPNCMVYNNTDNYMAVILTINSENGYSDFSKWLWDILEAAINSHADS